MMRFVATVFLWLSFLTFFVTSTLDGDHAGGLVELPTRQRRGLPESSKARGIAGSSPGRLASETPTALEMIRSPGRSEVMSSTASSSGGKAIWRVLVLVVGSLSAAATTFPQKFPNRAGYQAALQKLSHFLLTSLRLSATVARTAGRALAHRPHLILRMAEMSALVSFVLYAKLELRMRGRILHYALQLLPAALKAIKKHRPCPFYGSLFVISGFCRVWTQVFVPRALHFLLVNRKAGSGSCFLAKRAAHRGILLHLFGVSQQPPPFVDPFKYSRNFVAPFWGVLTALDPFAELVALYR